MDEQRGTQKQIAKRYRDKVDYYNTSSPWRRARFWISFIAIVGGSAAIYFARKRTPPEFFNTGPLSRHHSALADRDCVACHKPESLNEVAHRVRALRPGPERSLSQRRALIRADRSGLPDVSQAARVSRAERGRESFLLRLSQGTSGSRADAGGREALIAPLATTTATSCKPPRQAGKQLPPTQFRLNPKVVNITGARSVIVQLPRPPDGYTQTFASFRDGHPPFQLHREKVRESDVLRFNHQRHLSGPGIPPTKAGAKLDCNYCHKPEPNGRYMQRVSFEASCQECHSLQFDVKNPDFQLPHGDAQLVRTFLRTLARRSMPNSRGASAA